MSMIDSIMNLLVGDKETKAVNALGGIIEAIKPLLAEGKLGELVQAEIGRAHV